LHTMNKMNHNLLKFLFLIFMLGGSTPGQGENPIFKVDPSYLSKHDIVYKTPAYEGFEGFPPGNDGLWPWNHDIRNWVTPHHWNTQQQYLGLCAENDCELLLPYINTYFRLIPYAEKFAELRGAKNAILWSKPHDFFGSMTFWNRGDMVNDFTSASQIAGLFWEYYQFTMDNSFLEQKGYLFMKKTAEFYEKRNPPFAAISTEIILQYRSLV